MKFYPGIRISIVILTKTLSSHSRPERLSLKIHEAECAYMSE